MAQSAFDADLASIASDNKLRCKEDGGTTQRLQSGLAAKRINHQRLPRSRPNTRSRVAWESAIAEIA